MLNRLTIASKALYLFFKFYLKSRVVELSDIDFCEEWLSIRQEKERSERMEPLKTGGVKFYLKKFAHLF